MKTAAKVTFIAAMLFAVLTLSAYSIASAAPGSKLGSLFQSLNSGASAESPGDGSQTLEAEGSPEVGISETPESAETMESDETGSSDLEASEDVDTNADDEDSIDENGDQSSDGEDVDEDNGQADDQEDQDGETDDDEEDDSSSIQSGITAWMTFGSLE